MLKRIGKKAVKVSSWLTGVLMAALLGLFIYQNAATASHRPDMPDGGHMVDVGGYRLFMQTRGEAGGNPTVVFDSGLGTASSTADWSLVAPQVATRTRVVTYDRAGYGFSDDTDTPRTSARLAEDLHTMLHNGGVPGPYVLVGHSLGGFTVRMFAQRYPTEVAGVVLVDAAQEDGPEETLPVTTLMLARKAGLIRGAGAIGLLPAGPYTKTLAAPDVELMNEFTYARMFDTAQRSEYEQATTQANRAALRDYRAAGFGDKPLVVLTASKTVQAQPTWGPLQRAQLKLSKRSRQTIVDSAHHIQWEQPQAVIDAVSQIPSGRSS